MPRVLPHSRRVARKQQTRFLQFLGGSLCGFLKLLCSLMCWVDSPIMIKDPAGRYANPVYSASHQAPAASCQLPATNHQPPATGSRKSHREEVLGFRTAPGAIPATGSALAQLKCAYSRCARQELTFKQLLNQQWLADHWRCDGSRELNLTGTNEFKRALRESAAPFHRPKFTSTTLSPGQAGAKGF